MRSCHCLRMVSIIAARFHKHHPMASDLHPPHILKHKPRFSTQRHIHGMRPYHPPAYLPDLTALWGNGNIRRNQLICVNRSRNKTKNKHSNKQKNFCFGWEQEQNLHRFLNDPKQTFAILCYVLCMQSNILRAGEYKAKMSIKSENY